MKRPKEAPLRHRLLIAPVTALLLSPVFAFAEEQCGGTATITYEKRCEQYCGTEPTDPPSHSWNENTYKLVHFHENPDCDYEFYYSTDPCACDHW